MDRFVPAYLDRSGRECSARFSASGFSCRLGELERHPVALPDCQIFGAILFTRAQSWREVPTRAVIFKLPIRPFRPRT